MYLFILFYYNLCDILTNYQMHRKWSSSLLYVRVDVSVPLCQSAAESAAVQPNSSTPQRASAVT